ncbi:hypothetical protein [Desulfoferrobacter suflitae]|uniref:hypothetical protein n=1 Tax=Desulfoferrobacter suflitae TaxID=2865782 RepID=UPI0021641F6E|nr:hypothetical protein [Desulfoferrobacter suflitae]MCK8601231.1 hypothetical protein [Desulfoferrobacter suflitae]
MTKSGQNPGNQMMIELTADGKVEYDTDAATGRRKPKVTGKINGVDKESTVLSEAEFQRLHDEGKLEYVGVILRTHSSPWCHIYYIGGTPVMICV